MIHGKVFRKKVFFCMKVEVRLTRLPVLPLSGLFVRFTKFLVWRKKPLGATTIDEQI